MLQKRPRVGNDAVARHEQLGSECVGLDLCSPSLCFQQWALDELERWPETRGRVFPHTTTSAKHNRHDGFPSLKLEFLVGRWIVPTGDAASLRMARFLQSELAAMRYVEGRVSIVGEHDDLAITAWLLERAVGKLNELFAQASADEVVYGEDLGIERVHIGDPYP